MSYIIFKKVKEKTEKKLGYHVVPDSVVLQYEVVFCFYGLFSLLKIVKLLFYLYLCYFYKNHHTKNLIYQS